jgi:hypothetical protein
MDNLTIPLNNSACLFTRGDKYRLTIIGGRVSSHKRLHETAQSMDSNLKKSILIVWTRQKVLTEDGKVDGRQTRLLLKEILKICYIPDIILNVFYSGATHLENRPMAKLEANRV